MNGAAAVLDIGKTNVKVATFARDGALLWERAMPNRVCAGPPYPHADVEKIWEFLHRRARRRQQGASDCNDRRDDACLHRRAWSTIPASCCR